MDRIWLHFCYLKREIGSTPMKILYDQTGSAEAELVQVGAVSACDFQMDFRALCSLLGRCFYCHWQPAGAEGWRNHLQRQITYPDQFHPGIEQSVLSQRLQKILNEQNRVCRTSLSDHLGRIRVKTTRSIPCISKFHGQTDDHVY